MDEAFLSINTAIKENPNYAEAYNNLGVLYRDEGAIDQAIACYEKCLELATNSRNAAQNRLLAMNCILSLSLTLELYIYINGDEYIPLLVIRFYKGYH